MASRVNYLEEYALLKKGCVRFLKLVLRYEKVLDQLDQEREQENRRREIVYGDQKKFLLVAFEDQVVLVSFTNFFA